MHYPQPYRHYSELFGIPERSIKRWVAVGKKANPPDLPPLDRPTELTAWWSRHSNQRPPARLVQHLAGEKPKSNPVTNDANDVSFNEQDNADPLAQAQRHLAIANARYHEALKPTAEGLAPDEGRINQWHRIWLNTHEEVLKAQRAHEEQQRIRGQWASIAEVSADLATTLEYLRHIRSSLARRVAAQISNLLEPSLLEKITATIRAEQANEESLLRRIGSISRPDQDEQLLALTA